ncbi:33182_t:CDS:1 [Racocetra persica]|uniref:33182_t:CDS:1 n=1 Tax=Racocetra persica TaxID=160502 RepID=A0ACA9MVG1_9GLOM|nr:33182_t:CDS:1 [Racocetra persica]
MPKKYYEILGVSETATQEEIKKAYKDLVLKWHPDKFGSTGHLAQNREVATEKFKEIGEVYRVLSDSMIRSMYDEYGEKWKEHLEATGNEEFFEDDANKRERLAQTKVIFYINNELSLHWKLEEEDLDPKLWIPHHD